jgi:pyruvate,orthophosphate dikinase
MIAAEGILTARGGVSSHAALVARQMGKVCVCGAAGVSIDYDKKTATIAGQTFAEGDFLSIDGTSGTRLRRPDQDRAVRDHHRPPQRRQGRAGHREVQELRAAHEVVREGHAPLGPHQRRHPRADAERDRVRRRRHRPHPHRAHVLRGRPHRRHARDDPRRHARGPRGRARQAPPLPARGLLRHLQGAQGLSRHDPLPRSAAARVPAPLQGAADGPRPKKLGIAVEKIMARVHELHEFNPMLGFRGCRLGIKYPGDHRMQARAVFEAAADANKPATRPSPRS